jgi:NAD(P)-dependent dehydrogenase (short-subunit alcohol dehydrogenase family)
VDAAAEDGHVANHAVAAPRLAPVMPWSQSLVGPQWDPTARDQGPHGCDHQRVGATLPHMTNTAPTTWFITGASSGMGLSLARAAAGRGDNVAALARSVDSLASLADECGGRMLTMPVDVRRQEEVDDAVARTVDAFGRIDVVHNNAGYGLAGAVEEAADDQARSVFDTNVFGNLNVLRATLPVLRRQGSGHVLQGSSFYGRVTHPGVGLLCATKYALEGLTDAMAKEIAPFGIKVTMVEPGPTATPFGANFHVAGRIDDYDETLRAPQPEPAPPGDDPDRVAAAIIAAVEAERPPLRLITGSVALSEIRAELQSQLAELEAWAEIAEGVDRPLTAA